MCFIILALVGQSIFWIHQHQPTHITSCHIGIVIFQFLILNMDCPSLFLFIFVLFHIRIQLQIEKSVDGVLGIRTRGHRMVGTDKTTELWRPPNISIITHLNEIELDGTFVWQHYCIIEGHKNLLFVTLSFFKNGQFAAPILDKVNNK